MPAKFAAVPVVLAALFGISPLNRAGNCACGRVPVVKSDAETVTFPESAWLFTVMLVGTYPGTIGEPLNTGDAVSASVVPLPEVP